MNNKKKSLVISLIFVGIIQSLLFINNRQKTSFKYFIWNTNDVSIGRLICISFLSGLLMSSILSKTLNNNNLTAYSKNKDDDKSISEEEDSLNTDNIESLEMPPERDLRDTQPTISVNYRVIKDNSEREINDINQKSKNPKYQDDWNNNDSEW